ncbi:MAG TPA: hypothetical protein VFW87_15290 [Pirellulales bacterium]|nr:hypothetical protein [Pirellulales bacterium]
MLTIAAGVSIARAADPPPKATAPARTLELRVECNKRLFPKDPEQKRQIETFYRSLEEQARIYLAPFRERLELELHHVKQTCELTGDEAAALRKQQSDFVELTVSELVEALAAQGAQPRQGFAVVNGNLVEVPMGFSGQYLADPAKAARHAAQRQVARVLPGPAQAALAAAQRQQTDRALAASRLAALAILDEELILSRSQRDELDKLLASVWRTPLDWDHNPVIVGRYEAEALYCVHALLPQSQLAPVLRPAQQAAWRFVSEAVAAPRAGARRILGRRAFAVQLQFEQELGEKGRLKVVIRDIQSAAMPKNPQGEPKPVSQLDLIIGAIAADCGLSHGQRIKLQLAAELDAKRMRPQEADSRPANLVAADVNAKGGRIQVSRKPGDGGIVAGRVVLSPSILAVDPQIELLSNAASAYQRLLNGRLSDDQLQQLADANHQRRVLYERAAIAAVLQAIDALVFLSAEQHGRLTKRFQQHLAATADADELALPRSASMTRLARISARQLEPMFDDAQRPVAMSFWEELCAAIATPAVEPDARKQERPAGLNLF